MAKIIFVLATIVAEETIQVKEFNWKRQCELASKGRMMYTPNIKYVCIERINDESRKDMGKQLN